MKVFVENNRIDGFFMFYKQWLYKQVITRQDKNLSNSSTGQRHAKQFENFSSDPIGNENRAVEKLVTVDISTLGHFLCKIP